MKHHLVFNENCLYGKYVYNSELSQYSELSQKLGFHSVENRVIVSISYTE